MKADERIFRDFQLSRMDSFYESMYPALVVYASNFLPSHLSFMAEDCVQDAVYSTFRYRSNIFSFSAFRSFLYKSVRNNAISVLRHDRSRENYVSVKFSDEADLNDEILESETRRLINQAVDSLPEKLRSIFDLSYIQGLKNGEIAERLGISESSVIKQKAQIKLFLHDRIYGASPAIIAFFLMLFYCLEG